MPGSRLTWTNTTVRLGDLKPWADNPKYSTKAQAERIIKSFDKFGQVQTIAIGPECEVYDGHQRLSALLTLHGPDHRIDARQSSRALTDAERRELVITLHTAAVGSYDWQSLSGWDAQELIGWGMDDGVLKEWNNDANNLGELLKSEQVESADAEPQFDRAAELHEKWGVRAGDLWQVGEHRILCGSSDNGKNWNKLCDNERATLTWTDPPYGVNYGDKIEAANPMGYRVRRIKNDDMKAEELEPFIRSVLKNCADYSVAGASIYVASTAGTQLPTLISAFAGSGFDFRWHLVWVKDQIVLSRADYHFKHENILYGWKDDGAHYFIDNRKQSSVFEYPRPKKSEEYPTMKPIELIMHMITNSSKLGDIVFDPFCGSGSTVIACQNLGRRARAIEISPVYVSVALERMSVAFPGMEIRRIEAT